MAIADAFYLLFKVDAKDAKKGIDGIDKSIDHLHSKVKNTAISLGKSLAAFASIAAIVSVSKYADSLGELSEALEVDVEKLSAWSDAVKISGGSAEGFQETLKTMTAALQENAVKGKSRITPFYNALGIKLKDAKGHAREFLDILPELSSRFERLSKQQAFGLGQKLGLDRGTTMLLQKGRQEVEAVIKRQKELGVITKEDAAIAAKFNDELDDTAHVFRSVFVQAGSLVLPVLSKLLRGVQAVFLFLRDNKDFAVGAVIAIASAVTVALIPALVRLAIASKPFLGLATIITTVAGAFALLYDDVQGYLNGQKSFIGYIFKEYPMVKTIIMGLINSIKILLEIFYTLGAYIKDSLLAPGEALRNLKNNITAVITDIGRLFPTLQPHIEAIKSAFATAGDFVKAVWESVTATLQKTVDGVLAVVQALSSLKSAVTSRFSSPVPTSASNPFAKNNIAGQSFSTISSPTTFGGNKSINVSTGSIEITTQATDAPAIASSFTTELTRQLRQAINTFDDGVAI